MTVVVAAAAQRGGQRDELGRPVLERHGQADQGGRARQEIGDDRRDLVARVEAEERCRHPRRADAGSQRADRQVVFQLGPHEHGDRTWRHCCTAPSLDRAG
jgi:hypothetical protein